MIYTSVNTAGWKANPIDWEQSKSQIETTIKTKVYAYVAKTLKKIKILRVNAAGIEFKPLIPGSIHDVIDPPAGYDNSRGVWVMGYSEPVLVLFGEYDEIEEGGEQ